MQTLSSPVSSAGVRPVAVLVGRRGDRYSLGPAPIGSGAQAEVWPAERDDGQLVAIKLARPGRSAMEALNAEGRWLEALTHGGMTCAVPCFDRVDWDGRPGLVLPRFRYHVGELVRARIDAERGKALESVLTVGVQLARALAMFHRAEVGATGGRLVHRDVKPENVLVDAVGALRLADLGGSLLTDGMAPRDLGVFGSLQWAPPDQMLPGIAEPNTSWDTYAACVMLFAWITGQKPSCQVDPSARLTDLGRELHGRLRTLATADLASRSAAVEDLFRARAGVRVADIVDPEASPELPVADRALLARGVGALAEPARYGDEALEAAVDGLVGVFERGLSPHTDPSPPHRYRDAGDLADTLEDIAVALGAARRRRQLAERPPRIRVERTAGGVPVEIRATLLPADDRPAWLPRDTREAARVPTKPVEDEPPSRVPVLALLVLFGAVGGAGGAVVLERTAAVHVAPVVEPASVRALPNGVVEVAADRGGEAFHIGRTEVTNAAYAACVAAGGCSPVDTGKLGPALLDGETQPVVGVTWHQAAAWCAWAGGRLPTETEWERAALHAPSGGERPLPWGAAPMDCTRANTAACGLGVTAAADAFADGASAWGALQMYGNAWEWTATRGPGGTRVLRGGAFDTPPAEVAEGARRRDPPGRVAATYSFRCAFPGDGTSDGMAGARRD